MNKLGRSHSVCVIIFSLGVLLLAEVILSGSPTYASGGGDGCNPGRNDDFDHPYWLGMYQYASGDIFGGAQANILTYSPYVYYSPFAPDTVNDASSEYVQLVDQYNQYTALGWVEQVGSVRSTFIEYHLSSGYFQHLTYSRTPINSMNNYNIVYDPSTQEFGFYVNGQGLRSLQLYAPPIEALVRALIRTSASQMPGGTANYNYAEYARVYEPAGSSGNWTTAQATTENVTATFAHVLPPNGTYPVSSYSSYDNNCVF